MVPVTQPPATMAAATFALLCVKKIESGEYLAALLCLALSHRARLTSGRVINCNAGIMSFDDVEHGNTGRQGYERRANK